MAAERLMRAVDALLPKIRREAPNSADHLERSTEAVLFNIAEGVGAYKPKVKISAREVAKKEANEVRAVLRRLLIKRVLSSDDIAEPCNLAGAIIGMLTNAIITLGDR